MSEAKKSDILKSAVESLASAYVVKSNNSAVTVVELSQAFKAVEEEVEKLNAEVKKETYERWAKESNPIYVALKDGTTISYKVSYKQDKAGNLTKAELAPRESTVDILDFAKVKEVKLPGDVLSAVNDFIFVAGADLTLKRKNADPAVVLDLYKKSMTAAGRSKEIDVSSNVVGRGIKEEFLLEYVQKVFDSILFQKYKGANKYRATMQDAYRCLDAISRICPKAVDKLTNTKKMLDPITQAITVNLNKGVYTIQTGKDSSF